MKLRDRVKNKYGGLCAYTGKPLDDKWQIDHVEPLIRKQKLVHGHYRWRESKKPVEDFNSLTDEQFNQTERVPNKLVPDGYKNPEAHCFENMVPAIKIINHYKSSLNLEEFRRYISKLHERLKKLPKNTKLKSSIRRKEYVLEVAALFEITPEKPFSGKFYFETLE